ncbi:AAA family ATPase [Sphingobium baderi]|uniref:AAA family ATPase n=1 Tax=Sphingobium baderi TaxID=1332080 RepID=UPI002B414297|nr:AAA family ATPase [Sphingobium baderi]WRD76342.1 AAA family ATPase [Sphingobium baderi]
MPDSLFDTMRSAPIWMVWKAVKEPGRSKARKVPFYINGAPRSGVLDSAEDRGQLVSYENAQTALEQSCGVYAGLAIALGPDGRGGHWQGIDLDDIEANGLSDIANRWVRGDCGGWGYVEASPSGNGAHIIGYGKPFSALGSNGTGIEAYASGRFFTFTGLAALNDSPCRMVDLNGYVEQHLVPRHSAGRAASAGSGEEPAVHVDSKTVTELRSALTYLRADDRHLWVAVGHALKELGEVGRELWLTWSRSSAEHDPVKDPKRWDGFNPTHTSYQAVFKKAQDAGWTNPASNAAQPDHVTIDSSAPPAGRKLVGRSLAGVAMRAIEWLWVGWLPKGYITILAGETGAGKSTVFADIAARITTGAPWPGEHDCPNTRRVPERVLWLGSEDSIEEMTIPRLRACGANLDNVIEITGAMQNGKRNTFSMQDDIEAVAEWLAYARDTEKKPFAMLVIDPVTSYLPGQKLKKVDMNDAGQLRTILEPWLPLAQKFNIAIVCVTHFAKDTTKSMVHRVMGSSAFAQTCRSLCAVIEQPAKEDEEPDPHAKVFMQVKVNLPEHPGGAWKFCTERVEVGIDPRNGKPIYATKPAWDELDSALTPNTAIGKSRGPKSQYDAPFSMWLHQFFGRFPNHEWLAVSTVRNAAIDEKFASASWWDKHSGDYMDKQNVGGEWQCRPKKSPA